MSLYEQRSSFLTTACTFDREREDRWKMIKSLTDILAEVLYPGSPQVNLGQEDLSESEGGRREGGKEKERETETVTERIISILER